MPLGKVLSRAPSARSEANRVTEKRTGKGELSALAMRGDAPERISHSDDERIKRNAKGLRDPGRDKISVAFQSVGLLPRQTMFDTTAYALSCRARVSQVYATNRP